MKIRTLLASVCFVTVASNASAFEAVVDTKIIEASHEQSGVPIWIVARVEYGDVMTDLCKRLRHVIHAVYGYTSEVSVQSCLTGLQEQNPKLFPTIKSLDKISPGDIVIIPDPSVPMDVVAAQMNRRKEYLSKDESVEDKNPLVQASWLQEVGRRLEALEATVTGHAAVIQTHTSRIDVHEDRLDVLEKALEEQSVITPDPSVTACPIGFVCVPDNQVIITVEPNAPSV